MLFHLLLVKEHDHVSVNSEYFFHKIIISTACWSESLNTKIEMSRNSVSKSLASDDRHLQPVTRGGVSEGRRPELSP